MGILEGILYMIWRGLAIGIIISAPMGPVGILCIQRTLERGRRVGFLTGVGAAISDLLYCLLTGFGLSFIEDFLKTNQNAIQIIGSVVLVGFGVYIFQSNPTRNLRTPEMSKPSGRKNVLNGFLFTFSNPLIIFLIIGLFARFNFLLPEIRSYHYAIGFTMIIAGALLWWFFVTFLVDKVRSHFNLRSMWLINKITGSIIMIFGIVGVITAVSGFMHAEQRNPVYLNSVRGFGNAAEAGAPLTIENSSADTIFKAIPLYGLNCEVEGRVRAINNASQKSYTYTSADGKKHKVKHPTWGFFFTNASSRNCISFHTEEGIDDIHDPQVLISTGNQEKAVSLNAFDGWNAFKAKIADGNVSLVGGEHEYNKLAELSLQEPADSIGVFLTPGAALALDFIAVTPSETNKLNSADIINNNSYDKYSGTWSVLDMNLDDSVLGTGGDYQLQMVATDSGYALLYTGGADYHKAEWKEGDVKALLNSSSVKGVYDVTWYDTAGKPLADTGKAQFGKDYTLTITFPRYASSIRLTKLNH